MAKHKRIPNVAEVAASLGQSQPSPSTPVRYPRLLPEERAEIVRSVRFTRAQIKYLNQVAGKQTMQTGRSISVSDVLRQLIDEKLASSD